MSANNLDGWYTIYPMGGCAEYARIRGGRVVAGTSESELGTHVAAGDALAWLASLTDREQVDITDDDEADTLRAILAPDCEADCVAFARIVR